jgi:aldose 1-epimerase
VTAAPAGQPFGVAPDGSVVEPVVLERGGSKASLITWGASLQDFRLSGVSHSLVLGSPRFEPYLDLMNHFGAIAGRVANRIAGGRAELDGRVIELERNEGGETCLHGGSGGSGVSNWNLEGHDASRCRMSLRMPDGGGGFPGALNLGVEYRLEEDGALSVEIEAASDAPTFCNPAQHSYWNLSGEADLSHHKLTVHAERYLEVDARKIPLGEPRPVAGTPFDYRKAASLPGEEGPPLDHNFCLRDEPGELRRAAVLEAGGIELRVFTTEPGLQVYDGLHIDSGQHLGHSGTPYGARAGIALEPQRWPDAPNHPGYPSILLRPGETYRQLSRFHAKR